ncbi:MAG TPA: 2-amino-4-hydroxy-6-hydroxymethyldihydropteridine diphosphokinase [Chitinophagaceae bacterium]|nr:2-amino-4-hydroxy-6-hydroxymethyldihydropteridine diphosphokinase [Chitinophagaceae bacterium]
MNKVYLSIGGNMGNREAALAKACKLIGEQCGELTSISSLYETAAWGKNDQPAFLNQVLEINSELEPGQLLKQILKIEKEIGRIRKEKYGPRSIDIDILFFNNETHDHPSLTIPHPEIQYRRFVLVPMNEIAPALVHPVLKKAITELLEECPDHLPVKKI